MDKKKYFAFAGVCGKLSVVTAALVAVLFMGQSSRAEITTTSPLIEISKSIDRLTDKIGELVVVEKEQNELLRSIRNKLSDIAVIQSCDSNRLYTRFAESDKDSGFKSPVLNQLPIPSRDAPIYYYYNGEIETQTKKGKGDE